MDPVLFKELLTTKLLKVELHDCDEYVAAEDEKDAKFSVGCAQFTIKDFLRPNCKELKLRSDIFPASRLTNNFLVLLTAGTIFDAAFCNFKVRSNNELYILMFQTAA